MSSCSLHINNRRVTVPNGITLLEAARQEQISIPTLCYLEGLTAVAACRLCLVDVSGSEEPRLLAACVTSCAEGMQVHTDTPRLREIRRTLIELLFTEGNHVCAICVANGHCELQNLAVAVGMDHSRLPYRFPERSLDLSHAQFGLDHNRCILCTRCVRVCDEVEGAHVWDVGWRGEHCRIISGLNEPWGDVSACTHCGKCVEVCPTGALFHKTETSEEKQSHPERLQALVQARTQQQWTP